MAASRFGELAFSLGITAFLAACAFGHTGDVVLPIVEISDEELAAISLEDQSLDEWRAIIGPPTLTAADFDTNPFGEAYNPADFDFQMWLGWHDATDRIYVAYQIADDIYLNEYAGFPAAMFQHDGSFSIAVDADHGGEPHTFPRNCCETEDEWRRANHGGAQTFQMLAQVPDGIHFSLFPNTASWPNVRPYADGAGGSSGESPRITFFEGYITPFDRFIWDAPTESVEADLSAGMTIGLQMAVSDIDETIGVGASLFVWPALDFDAPDLRGDAVLVKKDGSTNIDGQTWGRVKAGAE